MYVTVNLFVSFIVNVFGFFCTIFLCLEQHEHIIDCEKHGRQIQNYVNMKICLLFQTISHHYVCT
jgi:hypothetical protein